MASILVTGGSGFIGTHVARHLHDAGHDVTTSGRDSSRLAASSRPGMRTAQADLAIDPLAALVASHDAVVHCAALSSPWGRQEDFFIANVRATERLLASARQAGVGKFIFLSSPSIYFRLQDQFDLKEDFVPPSKWITHYAQSKWQAEERVRMACDGDMSAVILRPRAVFGEGDRAIFPRLIAKASRGRFPLVDGGRAMIDVTHVDNVCHAVACSLRACVPGGSTATFNISNGEPMRVRDLLEHLFRALPLDVRFVDLPRGLAMSLATLVEHVARAWPGHPEPPISRYTLGVLAYSQTLDISAARTALGYVPQTTLAEGIDRFAAWWASHDRR